jgi:hypothetical protein
VVSGTWWTLDRPLDQRPLGVDAPPGRGPARRGGRHRGAVRDGVLPEPCRRRPHRGGADHRARRRRAEGPAGALRRLAAGQGGSGLSLAGGSSSILNLCGLGPQPPHCGRGWGESQCWHRSPPPNPLPSEWEGEKRRGEARHASCRDLPHGVGEVPSRRRGGGGCRALSGSGSAVFIPGATCEPPPTPPCGRAHLARGHEGGPGVKRAGGKMRAGHVPRYGMRCEWCAEWATTTRGARPPHSIFRLLGCTLGGSPGILG